MGSDIVKKNQIKSIVNKFDKFDKIARNSFFITIIVFGIISIATNYHKASMPIFANIGTIIIALELVVLFIWMSKKGLLHMVRLSKLVEQVYGRVKTEDIAVARELLQSADGIMGSAKWLLKKGRVYSFFVALRLRGEIKSVLEGASYGIRQNAKEVQAMQEEIAKYTDIIFDNKTDKEEVENFIAKLNSVASSASYQLD